MDMPIQVMIVLFITILVASAVILFTQDVLNTSKQKLNNQWAEGAPDEKVLEVSSITKTGVDALIEECWNNYNDEWEKTLCYVLHGENSYDPTQNTNINNITVESSGSSSNTIFIYYDPSGKIEVTN